MKMPGRNRFGEELKFLDFQKGGTKILKISKGEEPEKIWGGGNQKEVRDFQSKMRGTQIFKLTLGIKKGENGDF